MFSSRPVPCTHHHILQLEVLGHTHQPLHIHTPQQVPQIAAHNLKVPVIQYKLRHNLQMRSR